MRFWCGFVFSWVFLVFSKQNVSPCLFCSVLLMDAYSNIVTWQVTMWEYPGIYTVVTHLTTLKFACWFCWQFFPCPFWNLCKEHKTFFSKGWQLQVSLLIHCEVVFFRVIICFYKTRHPFLQTRWCQNMFHTQTLHLQWMPSVAERQLWLNFFLLIPTLWTVEDDWEAKILEVLIYWVYVWKIFT